MIRASELTRIRRDVEAVALNLPCVIQRKTVTQEDVYGSDTEAWPVVSPEDLMCGMSEPSGTQLENFNFLVASLATWQVKLPYQTDVQHQDRLIVTGEYGPQTLVVQVILEPRSLASLVTVLASELK